MTCQIYFWVDGIYFDVRLEDPENKKQCFLVIIGAKEDGTKELVTVLDGYRESTLSWVELLSDLKREVLTQVHDSKIIYVYYPLVRLPDMLVLTLHVENFLTTDRLKLTY